MSFGFYFDRIFACNEMGYERYRLLYEQLGDLGLEREKGVTSITVGVLVVLRSYKDRKKLKALTKLSGQEEGFGDDALYLEARKNLLPLLERAHEAGERVTEEEVLDGVMVLGDTCMRVDNIWEECDSCFERAKEGFVCLLGEDHAKSVEVTQSLLIQTTVGDECITELRTL